MKIWFRTIGVAAATVVLASCAQVTDATKTANLITAAQDTIQTMKRNPDIRGFNKMLAEAQGVAVFPALIKGGFLIGAEGGSGVVLSRKADGSWGYPAFYTLAAGSVGFQAGAQTAEVVLVIRKKKAIEAIVKHQGKLGADISAAAGPRGVGYEGAVTTNLNFDIVVFSNNAGFYAGASLEGSAMIRRNDYNRAYYGGNPTPARILLEHAVQNPAADRLRQAIAGG